MSSDSGGGERTMAVERQVMLSVAAAGPGDAAVSDLSAVHCAGNVLWLVGDELPLLYRLTETAEGYGDSRTFELGDFVDLPEGAAAEIDVEGLDGAPDCLWLVGSHSRTRKRVDPGDDDAKVDKVLRTVDSHPNRNVLIRLPLTDGDDGLPAPSEGAGNGSAALLDGDLRRALAPDLHVGPFVDIPSKDNGLDIEGLVAVGDTLLLGLRGPVLRSWAVVLEVTPETDPVRPGRLRLGGPGPGYRIFFLDLDGLGVRDLCRAGNDVLVLAGPTMVLDGPSRLYRWRGAAKARPHTAVRRNDLARIVELPFGQGADEGTDHAEGVTLLPDEDAVLVVYDSPSPARAVPAGVRADVLRLRVPGPRSPGDSDASPASARPSLLPTEVHR
jgi:hypothetical protein